MNNRRRSVFEVNTIKQTQLKQQEESLSNEIDQNLRTLALMQPLSDAAKPLLVKVMCTNQLVFCLNLHFSLVFQNFVVFLSFVENS